MQFDNQQCENNKNLVVGSSSNQAYVGSFGNQLLQEFW